MFLTGQWLYDSPLHYIQLWMDVSIIVVFTRLYDSIFACLAVGQTIFNTVSIVKEDWSITGTYLNIQFQPCGCIQLVSFSIFQNKNPIDHQNSHLQKSTQSNVSRLLYHYKWLQLTVYIPLSFISSQCSHRQRFYTSSDFWNACTRYMYMYILYVYCTVHSVHLYHSVCTCIHIMFYSLNNWGAWDVWLLTSTVHACLLPVRMMCVL